ncbi:MAG: nuclear transport factor 2 family protein [Pseudomonadota bacterium]
MSFDLNAMEAIKQLKYRYVRALDTADLETLGTCFTDDAHIKFEGGIYTVEYTGRDAILEFMGMSFHSKAATSHQVHHPVIEIESETRATGQWSLQDYFYDLNMKMIVFGASEYHDVYVKEGDAWKIADSGYTRLYEMTQPFPESLTCTFNKLAETGRDVTLGI